MTTRLEQEMKSDQRENHGDKFNLATGLTSSNTELGLEKRGTQRTKLQGKDTG